MSRRCRTGSPAALAPPVLRCIRPSMAKSVTEDRMTNKDVLMSAETPDRMSQCRGGHEGRERPWMARADESRSDPRGPRATMDDGQGCPNVCGAMDGESRRGESAACSSQRPGRADRARVKRLLRLLHFFEQFIHGLLSKNFVTFFRPVAFVATEPLEKCNHAIHSEPFPKGSQTFLINLFSGHFTHGSTPPA